MFIALSIHKSWDAFVRRYNLFSFTTGYMVFFLVQGRVFFSQCSNQSGVSFQLAAPMPTKKFTHSWVCPLALGVACAWVVGSPKSSCTRCWPRWVLIMFCTWLCQSYPLLICHIWFPAQIFRKYKVSYNSGEFVYRVNSTYIPQSPLNFKLTLRDEWAVCTKGNRRPIMELKAAVTHGGCVIFIVKAQLLLLCFILIKQMYMEHSSDKFSTSHRHERSATPI